MKTTTMKLIVHMHSLHDSIQQYQKTDSAPLLLRRQLGKESERMLKEGGWMIDGWVEEEQQVQYCCYVALAAAVAVAAKVVLAILLVSVPPWTWVWVGHSSCSYSSHSLPQRPAAVVVSVRSPGVELHQHRMLDVHTSCE